MDERAPWFVSLDRELQRAMFWGNFHDSFAGLGAPVDLLLLSDLPKADIGRYRAVFLPTCLFLNEAERRRIDGLKAGGRTLVFYQADGLINPDAEEVVFVGDGHGDYEAALSCGCEFVGIRNQQNTFQQQSVYSLDDLLGLPAMLDHLSGE